MTTEKGPSPKTRPGSPLFIVTQGRKGSLGVCVPERAMGRKARPTRTQGSGQVPGGVASGQKILFLEKEAQPFLRLQAPHPRAGEQGS